MGVTGKDSRSSKAKRSKAASMPRITWRKLRETFEVRNKGAAHNSAFSSRLSLHLNEKGLLSEGRKI